MRMFLQLSGMMTVGVCLCLAAPAATNRSPLSVAVSPDGKSIQDNGVTPNVLQAEAEIAPADGAADDSLPDVAPDDAKKPGVDELMNRALKVLPE